MLKSPQTVGQALFMINFPFIITGHGTILGVA